VSRTQETGVRSQKSGGWRLLFRWACDYFRFVRSAVTVWGIPVRSHAEFEDACRDHPVLRWEFERLKEIEKGLRGKAQT
jgi:hypothetical protein